MVGATSGEGTAYPSGASEYASPFSKVRVAQSLAFCVVLCGSLFFCLPFFLLAIALPDLRFTASDNTNGQKKKVKKIHKTLHSNLKIEQRKPHRKHVFNIHVVYCSHFCFTQVINICAFECLCYKHKCSFTTYVPCFRIRPFFLSHYDMYTMLITNS